MKNKGKYTIEKIKICFFEKGNKTIKNQQEFSREKRKGTTNIRNGIVLIIIDLINV